MSVTQVFGDPEDLEPEKLQEFKDLQQEAKSLAKEGEIQSSLEKLEKAFLICPTQKLSQRIEKIKNFLQEEAQAQEEGDEMAEVHNGLYMYRPLLERLLPHQVEGVAWMWGLHRKKKGGILGDDMGLGKTIQIISYLSALFDGQHINNALLIMPVSLLPNWEKEFESWAPGINYQLFHGTCKRTRERGLLRVQKRGGVVMTSYGMAATSWEIMSTLSGASFVWDYVILDEGHKIKNPNKTTKAINAIPAKHRLLLTGTPIQNNLKELWSLFDFTHQGELLGSKKTFSTNYENPILRSREKCATVAEHQLGAAMAESLRKIIAPYFLRRTKAEIMKSDICKDHHLFKQKIPKNDLILWVYMSETQEQFYRDFLQHDRVKQVLMTSRSPLVELTFLKKICDHPRLLSSRAFGELSEDVVSEDLENRVEDWAPSLDRIPNETLLRESGKMVLVMRLLHNLVDQGHRTLIFSLSRRILDILERLLTERSIKYIRIDGSISKLSERERRIEKFQTDERYKVFLLTTQVGGVGLTLTGADRVIIYDPSWNPATDAQAVDRVYRIGQQKPVVVYRLIMCGTVEEKIYRRQIFKDSINHMATGQNKDPHRYFTKQELRDLFTLDDTRISTTQLQLEEMHAGKRKSYPELDSHLEFLRGHLNENMFGFSDHDLMFPHNPGSSHDSEPQSQVVQQMVAQAQELMKLESIQRNPLDVAQQMLIARKAGPPSSSAKEESEDLTRKFDELSLKPIEVPSSPEPESDPVIEEETPSPPPIKFEESTSPIIISDDSVWVPESPGVEKNNKIPGAGDEVQSSMVEGPSYLTSQNAPAVYWGASKVSTQDFNLVLSPNNSVQKSRRKSVAAPRPESLTALDDSIEEEKENFESFNKSQIFQQPAQTIKENVKADFSLQFSFPKGDQSEDKNSQSSMDVIGDSPVSHNPSKLQTSPKTELPPATPVAAEPDKVFFCTPFESLRPPVQLPECNTSESSPKRDYKPLFTSTPILQNISNMPKQKSLSSSRKAFFELCDNIESESDLKDSKPMHCSTPIPKKALDSPRINPDSKRILEKLSELQSPSPRRLGSVIALQENSDPSGSRNSPFFRKKKIMPLVNISDDSD